MPFLPAFPNVPQVPGVPQVPRDPNNPIQDAPPLATASTTAQAAPEKQWAVLDANGEIQQIFPDSVKGFKVSDKSKISDFPVEKGAFVDYNKVRHPIEVTMTFIKAESVAERGDFLGVLTILKNSFDLVQVVTPERTYLDMNLHEFDYSQEQGKNENILIVPCRFTEVRQVEAAYTTATITPAKAKNKSAADPAHKGKQQTKYEIEAARQEQAGAVAAGAKPAAKPGGGVA